MIKTNRNGQVESFKFLHSVLFQERRWFDMLHFLASWSQGFQVQVVSCWKFVMCGWVGKHAEV